MSANPKPEAPSPDSESVRAFYNRFSVERSVDYAKNGNPRIDKALARILPLVREDSRVLEIGCGAGLVTEQIARLTTRGSIWACDISDGAIALARDRCKTGNVQFRALDVAACFEDLNAWLPLPLDLVVMVDVLEHIPLNQHEALFRNLASVTNPEATVVLTFPSADYQRYLRQQHPEELQIIDEIIELPHLHEVTAANGFALKHFSLENVWLPNQYAHCVLTRGGANIFSADPNSFALSEIAGVIHSGETFILVDQDEWPQKAPPGRVAIPFLEKNGIYWGPPGDDETAIRECIRLQKAGAACIVFGWPAFWWLEHYTSFHRHLIANSSCLLKNERIIIYRFQQHESARPL